MEPLTCLGFPKDPPSLFGVVPLQKLHAFGDMPREVRAGRFLKPLQKGFGLFPSRTFFLKLFHLHHIRTRFKLRITGPNGPGGSLSGAAGRGR